ncbi:DUF2255 family protein [Nocardia gamkensis]|uniref:DUF2255 family protein n=1 Tax=Nocardia gamkensis TaxID=352869 RepID=UPI000AB19043|nr:DUF2255 family protein [Nocardia gamkensis]NQE66747.1 hypothetical protein [Nocardia gamkensis]
MSQWSESELAVLGAATELQVASRRGDSTLRRYVTIWGVRVGYAVYVRFAYGSDSAHVAIDAAYHAEYDRYGPKIVGSVVGAHATEVTLRLDPVS